MLGLGSLLAAVGSLAAQTFGELGRFAGQFSVRAALLVGLVGQLVVFGFYGTFNNVFWVVVALVAWRLAHRSSYDRTIGRWLTGAWRKWRLYEPRWEETMQNLHMTRIVRLGPDKCPKLGAVMPMPHWDEVRVRPLPGDTVEDWDELADALCESFDVDVRRHRPKWMKDRAMRLHARSCRVYNEPGRWIRLEIARGPDPLADPIPLPEVPDRPEEIDLEAVPIGIGERRQVVTVPVIGSHLLAAGITGAGKGSLLHAIILNLGPLIRDGSVRIWGLDPKRGVEMQFVKPLCYRFCEGDNEEMADMLEEAIAAMDASLVRLKADRARKITPSPDRPLNIVIIDELGRLTGPQETPQLHKRLNRLVGDLVNIGRAPGVGVVAFCQVPLKEIVQNRDEFPRKIAMHLESREYVDRLLGPGALKAGAKCHEIDLDMPGVAFMKVKGVREPTRIRVYHVTDAVIMEAAVRFRPPTAPTLSMQKTPYSPSSAKTLVAPAETATVDRVLAEIEEMAATVDLTKTVERQVTFRVPDCPRSMNTNEMRSRMGRWKAEKEWQGLFVAELEGLGLGVPLRRRGPLRGRMVHSFTDSRKRDIDNCWIAAKGLGDAVQAAGLVPDDGPGDWVLDQSIGRKGKAKMTTVTLSWDEPVS